jgi:hypothetical protein
MRFTEGVSVSIAFKAFALPVLFHIALKEDDQWEQLKSTSIHPPPCSPTLAGLA